MRKTIASIALGVATFLMWYLVCSFIELSWNPAEWTRGSRIALGLFGTISGIVVGLLKYSR